jgi:hypothetical protein
MSLTTNLHPLALFFADAHLDTGAWANRPLLKFDSIEAFKFICNYAISRNIPFIFGAGDLIDVRKPPPEVVQTVREQLSALERDNCQFYYTQGQHEFDHNLPWFSAIHSWPQHLNKSSVIVGDKCVYGLDWHTADKLPNAVQEIRSDTDILVMHQVWEEFMGDKCGCEGSLCDMPYATTLFTGDFHVNKVLQLRGKQGQALRVISPGSTNMRKINECADKWFYVLLSDYTWKRVRIPTRRKIEMVIGTEKSLLSFGVDFKKAFEAAKLEAMRLGVPNNLCRPICYVRYLEDLPDAHKTIKKHATDVELFLKPVSQKETEQLETPVVAAKLSSSFNLINALAHTYEQDTSSVNILTRLIRNQADMRLELQLLRKEFMNDVEE